MALEFRKVEDSREWDEYVLSLSNYSFLNSSARYEFSKEIGVKVFRFGLFNKDSFLGILICEIGHSKLFGNFLECKHSPLLIENKREYWEEILELLKNIAKKNNCFMIRLSPLYKKGDQGYENLLSFYENNTFLKAPTHNVDALVSQYIDLTRDLEKLRRDMNKTKRNLLNRLLKNNDVRIEVFDDTSQFDVFKELHRQTVRLKGYTDKPSSSIVKELEIQVRKNMCFMLIGYYKEKPIGVWQCTKYGDYLHLYHAGMDTQFREKNINITYLLFWKSIQLGKKLGCKTFDLFGGVVPEGFSGKKHPWSGIGAFKESLGGEKVTYIHNRDYPMRKIKYYLYYIYSWARTRLKGYTIDW